jgi:hypothetical protein
VTQQIEQAVEAKITIDKIMLVGGYGDSLALQTYIESILRELNDKHSLDLSLIPSEYSVCATGVAIGGVMRAQNKETGLKRNINFSVGRQRHPPMSSSPEDDYSDEVLAQPVTPAKKSGLPYITNTIFWDIKRVSQTDTSTSRSLMLTQH